MLEPSESDLASSNQTLFDQSRSPGKPTRINVDLDEVLQSAFINDFHRGEEPLSWSAGLFVMTCHREDPPLNIFPATWFSEPPC